MADLSATGTIEITDELTLNNPTLKVHTVNYDIATDKVFIECLFSEEGGIYPHSRTFEFLNEGGADLGWTDILNYINGHEVLNVFS